MFGEVIKAKSGVDTVSLAILFPAGSDIQILPDESMIASRGSIGPSAYSVYSLLFVLGTMVVVGEIVCVDTVAWVDAGCRTYGTTADGVVEAMDGRSFPAKSSNEAIVPLPAGDCSATQGRCVTGFTLIPLGSEPGL